MAITQWPDSDAQPQSSRHQLHSAKYSSTGIRELHTLTAQTGSRVSPTRKVTSQSSGMEARNFISSANPVLFSNVERSGSASAMPSRIKASGIWVYCNHTQILINQSNPGQQESKLQTMLASLRFSSENFLENTGAKPFRTTFYKLSKTF